MAMLESQTGKFPRVALKASSHNFLKRMMKMINRGVRCFPGVFDRAQALTTTPGQDGWTIADTSSSGTPTYLATTEDGGCMKLTLVSTSEAENVCMYHNDVLQFDLAQIQFVEIIAKVAGIDSATTLTMGLGNARNDTEDSVAINAWFRMEGSVSTTLVVAETDDSVVDNDDKATSQTLSSTYKTFKIDFMNGLSDVRFYIEGERVASSTTFVMSNITAGQNVQPIVQLAKASGTGVPSVSIAQFKIQYKYAYGA